MRVEANSKITAALFWIGTTCCSAYNGQFYVHNLIPPYKVRKHF